MFPSLLYANHGAAKKDFGRLRSWKDERASAEGVNGKRRYDISIKNDKNRHFMSKAETFSEFLTFPAFPRYAFSCISVLDMLICQDEAQISRNVSEKV